MPVLIRIYQEVYFNIMRDYVILTDSSCDLTAELAQELGITVVPLSLLLDGKEYLNYLDGREIGFKEFYDAIREGKAATTSAGSLAARPFLWIAPAVLMIPAAASSTAFIQASASFCACCAKAACIQR